MRQRGIPASSRPGRSLRARCRLGALVLLLGLASAGAPAARSAQWADRLAEACLRIQAAEGVELGVHVRDLDTGEAASCRASEHWYLASAVKVPIAIAVLRGVEAGRFALTTRLTVRAADLVDGGPLAAVATVGTRLQVGTLLERMIVDSDNTASDMLLGLVGVSNVNALVRELVPDGLARITTLGEVRRMIYAQLAPAAAGLDGERLLMLQRVPTDEARLALLAHLTGTPVAAFAVSGLDVAVARYYASGVNAGRLDAYGDLLAALVEGRTLGPEATAHLLELMGRIATGTNRIRAGLPTDARFAHKTGTQRARFCDAGAVVADRGGRDRRVVVVACTSGQPSRERAERALRQVGLALCRAGPLAPGPSDAGTCPNGDASPVRPAHAPRR